MILAYGFTNNFLTNVDNVTDNIRTTTYANALHVRMASFMDFLQWTPTTKTRNTPHRVNIPVSHVL